ncbi:MAG: hypothetical protein GY936_07355, partial [Ignavibacteriae bacterium]|nr:hypothetical protein [Ignavibacteriota bacterium]
KIEPINLIFIDNSKSISQFATSDETSKIISSAKRIIKNVNGKTEVFELGKTLKRIDNLEIDSIKFIDQGTNLSTIISLAKERENLSSIVIFSDGIITEGKNPVSEAQDLGIPIYIVGVGDTSNNNDVKITKIKNNEFIYTGAKTEIEITVKHSGFLNEKATIKLLENNSIIDQKSITLSSSEINRVTFDYSNQESGEYKLTAVVEINKKEKNTNNNLKSQVINIVETKKKIFIISGSPNTDLSAITNSLSSNKDFDVSSVVQLGTNKFYKNESSLSKLKDSDALFLINFPSAETNVELINEVLKVITSTNKPMFYCLSSNVDYRKLNYFKNLLPFKILNNKNTYEQNQVSIANSSNNLLGNNQQIKEQWEKLPPINITNSKIQPNASAGILLSANNKAIIFTNNIGSKKSIVINALNFWRWKLQAPNKEYNLFNNFIFNSVKWLTLKNDNNRFNVSLNKKDYNLGETIVFSASVYDETLEPINNASIQLEIENSKSKNNFTFNSVGNGLYESSINLNKSGMYNFSAKLFDQDKTKKTIQGKFNIDPIEVELTESKMNKELLVSLANVNNGKFISIAKSDELVDILINNYK